MTRVPLLLIEDPDGPGAAEDARLRAAALRRAGFSPQVTAAGAARHALASFRAEVTVIASSACGADEIARGLPAGPPVWWWPVSVGPAAPSRRPPWRISRTPPVIGAWVPGGGPAPVISADPNLAALDWSVVDAGGFARPHHPLWDGDYVLVPSFLAGEPGDRALTAFRAAARDHAALDLVVLADPQPAFERIARRMGIGTRVHFAGPATRDAEWAWLKPAAAMLIAGPGPLPAGLVIRALACGCPVLGSGAGGAGQSIHEWLVARGAAVTERTPIETALRRVLEGSAHVREAVEQGRREAAAHHAAAVGARLARGLAAHYAPTHAIPGHRAA